MTPEAGEFDSRFEQAIHHSPYPRILTNDGFRVTSFEAKVFARCARNYASIQNHLPPQYSETEERLSGVRKIRSDYTDKISKFADWAEASRGFRIY